MSYRAAVSEEAARLLNIPARDEPVLVCDGCGRTRPVSRDGAPYKWFINGKRAPGWCMATVGEHRRLDWCRTCATPERMARDVDAALRALRANQAFMGVDR